MTKEYLDKRGEDNFDVRSLRILLENANKRLNEWERCHAAFVTAGVTFPKENDEGLAEAKEVKARLEAALRKKGVDP